MEHVNPKVALFCFEHEDLSRAVHLLKSSRQLADSIGSLEFFIGDEGNIGQDLSLFFTVLALCDNLGNVTLGADADLDVNFDLEGFLTQLQSVRPQGLPMLQRLEVTRHSAAPVHRILQLLQSMPSLRICDVLPQSLGERLSAAKIAAVNPVHFQYLAVWPQYAELLLSLLVARRWTARALTLYIPWTCDTPLLAGIHWQSCSTLPVVALSIDCDRDVPGISELASFVVHACSALRQLDIKASDQAVSDLLHPILADPGFRLRHLSLNINLPLGVAAGRSQHVTAIAKLLLSLPPSLTALRSLRIEVTYRISAARGRARLAPVFDKLASLCMERRIVYSLHTRAAPPRLF